MTSNISVGFLITSRFIGTKPYEMTKFTACAILIVLRLIYHPAPVNNNSDAFRQPESKLQKTVIMSQPQAPVKKIWKKIIDGGKYKIAKRQLSIDIERDLLDLENLFCPAQQYLVINSPAKLASNS